MGIVEGLVWLVQSGHIADIAIVCLIAEAVWFATRSNGLTKQAFIGFNMLSGIFLMLALRNALTDGALLLIPLFLSTSFLMHLCELAARKHLFRQRPDSSARPDN